MVHTVIQHLLLLSMMSQAKQNSKKQNKKTNNKYNVKCGDSILWPQHILVEKRNCALLKNQLKINITIKFINCVPYIVE